ncbi:MAG TPA: GMC family oxidoreductase [Thermoanaerobaculia bacterium]|nr:GMC family oxidoreductase [Thermoanaerobaculia bacterium]
MRTVETDVCIVGAGISAALLAERLAETTAARIVVVEAGNRIFNLDDRFALRRRHLDYGENPWPDDHVRGQTGRGIQSRSMSVGGLALHWGATTPRYTPEDFKVRSLYGVGDDWPIDWGEIERWYQEAEERIGVAGEPGPPELDPRSAPYPMPPLPLSWNLERLREWGERSGIPFWPNPVGKNSRPWRGRNVCVRCDTCTICPTGAKYSPDFTFQELLANDRIELLSRTLVRRLALERGSERIEEVIALDRDRPDEGVRIRARTFVVAAGYAWSAHLLLLSAEDRFPTGLANRHDLVGRYLCGHRGVNAFVELPFPLFPGIYGMDSLLSKRFQRPGPLERYVRHDLRIWETSYGREARLRDDHGALLLGDAALDDWRGRTARGAARLRAYWDTLPGRDSRLTLDPARRNPWGDPTLRIDLVDHEDTLRLRAHTEESIRGTFERMVAAGGGSVLGVFPGELQDHPGGGCRMGASPETGVVDPWGRTWDHENLWVVGAPNLVTAGCNNGTLTFAALALRSASRIAEELPRA